MATSLIFTRYELLADIAFCLHVSWTELMQINDLAEDGLKLL